MLRKRVLLTITFGVLLLGIALAAIPFVSSLQPNPASSKVIDIDISAVPPGTSREFEWRGKPTIIFKPDKETAQNLISINDITNGADYTLENIPQFFLFTLLSKHLGCMVKDTGPSGHRAYGTVGYFDPCHRGF